MLYCFPKGDEEMGLYDNSDDDFETEDPGIKYEEKMDHVEIKEEPQSSNS
jgi:hypothetical protein